MLVPSSSLGSTLSGFTQALDAVVAALGVLAGLSGTPVESLAAETHRDWLSSLSRQLGGWPEASKYIQQWCAWRGISQSAGRLGLGPLLQAMEDGDVGADDAVRVLEGNYARWWIDLAIGASPKLRSFVAARHEKRLERFRTLDARTLDLSSRLARARIASRIPGMVMRQVDPACSPGNSPNGSGTFQCGS